MFSWFKNLFTKKQEKEFKEYVPPEEEFDLYEPKKRQIYRYFNGIEVVKADPMTISKKISEHGADLDIAIKVANSQHSDAPKALYEVIEKVRSVFNIKPFKEEGLSDVEVLGLFAHFINYCDTVKKNLKSS